MYEVRGYYKRLYFSDDLECGYVMTYSRDYEDALKEKERFLSNSMIEYVAIIERYKKCLKKNVLI